MFTYVAKQALAIAVKRRAVAHSQFEVPWTVWDSIPSQSWPTIRHEVVASSEHLAREAIAGHAVLGSLLIEADLSNCGALSPLAILELWNSLTLRRPRSILEMGCGVSTAVMAAYARHASSIHGDDVKVFSVEHSMMWIEHVQTRLRDTGLDGYVTLIHSPLETVCVAGREVNCYSPGTLAASIEPNSIDYLLVDGPPAFEPGQTRLGALPVAAKLLASGATVVLDDAARDDERRVINHWRKEFPRRLRRVRGLFSDRGQARFGWN